ncbi:MAG TPA: 4'-phosphopantetheinyl transferase superfamily protein [Candidatus Eisenbacteria bacterium]|nr:4'-phosphopantetheinyl transferase superfamily protein [Candidatus Eisenbacteria bacterium]
MSTREAILPSTEACESYFRGALGLPLVVGITSGDQRPPLTPAEEATKASLVGAPRLDDWLRARAGLKIVLANLGADTDTSTIRFPNARFSLSHCRRVAVAVGVGPGALLRGIGVDLEIGRTPPETSERFFLSPDEVAGLPVSDPDRSAALRRLWTIKEAVFKSDPNNTRRVLGDYRLEDPTSAVGQARKGDMVFEYASLAFPEGELSVAIHRLSFEVPQT